MRLAIYHLTAAALILCGCAAPHARSAIDSAAAEKQVIDTIKDYHAAYEALDFERASSFHAADFVYIFFTERAPAVAFPEILSEIWMKGVDHYEIAEDNFDVLMISADFAFVTLDFKDHTTYADGGIAETSGAMSYLLQRIGGWKIVRLHSSGPAPADLYEPTPAAELTNAN